LVGGLLKIFFSFILTSNFRQSAVMWGRGIWSNRYITLIVAEKA